MNKPKQEVKFRSISRLLLIRILLVSSLITAALTLNSFYIDYNEEMGMLEKTFRQIENSSIEGLSKSVWDLNAPNTAAILRGILQITDVVEVTIDKPEGNEEGEDPAMTTIHDTVKNLKKRDYSKESVLTREFQLTFEGEKIGQLRVVATKENANRRLTKKVWVFFISQGIKTFLVSFIILLIIKQSLTRHLKNLRDHLPNLKPDTESLLHLAPRSPYRDELNNIEETVNQMHRENFQLNQQLEKKVEERAREVINTKNRLITILNSLNQGIFLLDSSKTVATEYSQALETMLEKTHLQGQSILDLILNDCDLTSENVGLVLTAIDFSIGYKKFAWICHHQVFPQTLTYTYKKAQKVFAVEWIPVIKHDMIDGILIILRDNDKLQTPVENAS